MKAEEDGSPFPPLISVISRDLSGASPKLDFESSCEISFRTDISLVFLRLSSLSFFFLRASCEIFWWVVSEEEWSTDVPLLNEAK
jgi:hypothetical protein